MTTQSTTTAPSETVQAMAPQATGPQEKLFKDGAEGSPEALVADLLRRQTPFLTQNWRRIIASTEKDYLRCLCIKGGIINVVSQKVLIRLASPLPIPDGFYLISQKVVTRPPPRSTWFGFPMVDVAEPNFNEIASLSPPLMGQDVVGALLNFCVQVEASSGSIVMDKHRAYMLQRPDYSFNFPFNIQIPLVADPGNLAMALTECLRYPGGVLVSRQVAEDRSMPLFLGPIPLSWNNCVLVGTANLQARTPEDYTGTASYGS